MYNGTLHEQFSESSSQLNKKEWIRFKFFPDRINRIFLRFPDETVKITPAENGRPHLQRWCLSLSLVSDKTGGDSCETLIPRSGLHIPGFIRKPGMQKNPANPVNPVYVKD
jgi:hypothetical protein